MNMSTRILKLAVCALALLAASLPAHAQLMEFLKGKTEHRSQLYVYDVRGQVDAPVLKDMVYKALTEQTSSASVKENLVQGDPPRFPAKMTFREMSFMATVVQIPACDGASFTVSSSDNSLSAWGDSSQYMACAFRYADGWRVNLYVGMQSKEGGILDLGPKLARAVARKAGWASDPAAFMETSVDRLEQLFKEAGLQYALVEAVPNRANRTVAEDTLAKTQAAAEKRAADRGKRMAARAELQKLGIDASDRARFIRAVQSGDEDVVALFLEAGAIDPTEVDSSGRRPADYASKPAVRELLRAAASL